MEGGATEPLRRQGIVVPLAAMTLLAPVPRPPKLIAVWVNYEEHGAEAAVQAPQKAPLFFTKFSTASSAPAIRSSCRASAKKWIMKRSWRW